MERTANLATVTLPIPLQSDRDRCLQSGMDDYISKPINKADVVTVLQRHLPAMTAQKIEPILR